MGMIALLYAVVGLHLLSVRISEMKSTTPSMWDVYVLGVIYSMEQRGLELEEGSEKYYEWAILVTLSFFSMLLWPFGIVEKLTEI